MSDDRLKARRAKLWNQDPACRRCGELTILPEDLAIRYGVSAGDVPKVVPAAILDRMATIEHQRSRLNPARGSDFKESTTLFCRKCNAESNAAEIAALPPGRWEEITRLGTNNIRPLPSVPVDSLWKCNETGRVVRVVANDIVHHKSRSTHVIFEHGATKYVLQIHHFAKTHERAG